MHCSTTALVTVFNIEVDAFHTYFVGYTEILVHNTCERGVGEQGWQGDKTWRDNVRTVGNGGTITSLKGGIPTQKQDVASIHQAGGIITRIEGPHAYPNPHTYPHIDYHIKTIKGTLRILRLE